MKLQCSSCLVVTAEIMQSPQDSEENEVVARSFGASMCNVTTALDETLMRFSNEVKFM